MAEEVKKAEETVKKTAGAVKEEEAKAAARVKETAEKAKEAVQENAEKVIKSAGKATEKAVGTVKKTTRKAAATGKAAVKKTAAKAGEKKTAVKKTAAKKTVKAAEPACTVVLQYAGKEIRYSELLQTVQQIWKDKGEKKAPADIKIYVKPEENTAYYVVNNGEALGSFNI